MSDLQNILLDAKGDLRPWEPIPEALWGAIAAQCGPDELAEIEERISDLEAELEATEAWDGDTRDDIHKAIHMFRTIAAIARQGGK